MISTKASMEQAHASLRHLDRRANRQKNRQKKSSHLLARLCGLDMFHAFSVGITSGHYRSDLHPDKQGLCNSNAVNKNSVA